MCWVGQDIDCFFLFYSLVNKLKPGTIKQVGQRDLSFIKVKIKKPSCSFK